MVEGKENNRVTRLFVDKKYHGIGIARNLMNKIEKLYRKRGATKILVWSSLHAQKFYEKMGYRKTTRLIKKEGMIYQPMKKVLQIGAGAYHD
jgi:GNAT superfamily N-acetyltransferase